MVLENRRKIIKVAVTVTKQITTDTTAAIITVIAEVDLSFECGAAKVVSSIRTARLARWVH
jgi:hypothetical protein